MNCNWDAISSVVAAIGVLVAGIGIYLSTRLSSKIHEESISNSRAQQLLPIWKELISKLTRIDSNNPNNNDFRESLNGLIMIRSIYDLEIVDRNALKELFGSVFILIYKDIQAVNVMVTIGGTTQLGRDFLSANPKLVKLYNELL